MRSRQCDCIRAFKAYAACMTAIINVGSMFHVLVKGQGLRLRIGGDD